MEKETDRIQMDEKIKKSRIDPDILFEGRREKFLTAPSIYIFDIIPGMIMIVIASLYGGWWPEVCENQVVRFLWYGGWIWGILWMVDYVSYFLLGLSGFEKHTMRTFCFIMGVSKLTQIGTLIWGSVVLISSWPNWTDQEHLAGPVSTLEYCPYVPMMTALVIVISQWILMPVMFIFLFLSLYYDGCQNCFPV